MNYLKIPHLNYDCLDLFPKSVKVAVTTDKERITIYLPTELKDRLAELAKADRRSMTTMIEVLLVEALQARDRST